MINTLQKTVIVTGGIRGIGAAISLKLSSSGYNVIASYHSNDQKAKDFEDHHGIKTMKWDVSNHDECIKSVSRIIEEYGTVHGL